MGKHSKTTTDDILFPKRAVSDLRRQVQDLYELVGSLRASRDYGIQALKRIDAKFDNIDEAFSSVANDVLSLRERLDDLGSDKTEYAQPESLRLPDAYQRAEALRLATSANLHPDQIVPTAQKFLAFVSGEEQPVSTEQAVRNLKLIKRANEDFVNDLLDEYADLSDSAAVNVGRVREVLRRAAGLS